MKTLIIVIVAVIGSTWITASVKDVERVSKESMYYSDVTHRLKQAIESIHADLKAGDTERTEKKIELLNTAMQEIPMRLEGVSLHEMSEAFYQLDHPEDQNSEPVDADNQITRP